MKYKNKQNYSIHRYLNSLRETGNIIGNGFPEGYLGMNIATKFYPGVKQLGDEREKFIRYYVVLQRTFAICQPKK